MFHYEERTEATTGQRCIRGQSLSVLTQRIAFAMGGVAVSKLGEKTVLVGASERFNDTYAETVA